MRKLEFYVSRNNTPFAEQIIKNSSYANQNGFKFYKIFRKEWKHTLIWPTFQLEDDYSRQEIAFKPIDEQVNKKFKRSRTNSLKQRMLKYNGIEEKETLQLKDQEKTNLRLIDNSAFVFCETYMKRFLVPRIISNTQLSNICKYRVKGRVPILCFIYRGGKGSYVMWGNWCREEGCSVVSLAGLADKIRDFESSKF
jgi:hypothetical protein